jgi:hypothetical protein
MNKKIVIVDVGENPTLTKFNYMKNARTKQKISMYSCLDTILDDKIYINNDVPYISFTNDVMITDVIDGKALKSFSFYNLEVKDSQNIPVEETKYIRENLIDIEKVSGSYIQDEIGLISDFSAKDMNNFPQLVKEFVDRYELNLKLQDVLYSESLGLGAIWAVYYKDIVDPTTELVTDSIYTYNIVEKNSNFLKLEVMCKTTCTNHQILLNKLKSFNKINSINECSINIDLITGEKELNSSTVIRQEYEKDNKLFKTMETIRISSELIY